MDWPDSFAVDALETKPNTFHLTNDNIKQEDFSISDDNHLHVSESICYQQGPVSNCSISAPSNESVLSSPSNKETERFTGLNEEDLKDKTLPDHLKEGLDIVIVGINPSLASAHVGHHYAGPGNHFWTCLSLAGLVPMQVNCYDDEKMLDYGIGFTNVCTRPTKGAAELTRKEMKSGASIMLEKMRKYRPKIVVFNGKGIYEAYVGHKNFSMGRQPAPLNGTDTTVFVMPSSSARCAQLPRAEDKLPFFIALRKLRDYLRGDIAELSDSEVVFADYTEFRVTQPDPKSLRKAERRRKRKAEAAAAAAAAAIAASSSADGINGSGLEMNGTLLSTGQQHLVLDPSTGLLTSAPVANGIDHKSKSKSLKSSKRKRPSGSTPDLCLSSTVSTQSGPGVHLTAEAQFQQQQQLQQQFQQHQQHAFFFQQQQLQHQFVQSANQQHALAQPQQQVIVSGGQLVSATPMVTLSMSACPGATAIPVHPGTQAAMAAGCYAAPQFQFSTPGAAPQQFFISPQAAGAGAANGQAFLQWSAAPGAQNSSATTAVHFQQPPPQQQQQQQQVAAASWPATLYNGQQPSQQPQVGTALQPATAAASAVSINGQHQQQLLAAQQQHATVQVAQQAQQLFFSPQHAMGLHAAGASAYPQQIYLAQTPTGASYHLLPVGCAASNFTSLLLSEQQQQQQQQQSQLSQCPVATSAQLQRTQTGVQLQTSQQPSPQLQQAQQQFQHQQIQGHSQQIAHAQQQQQHAYFPSHHTATMLPADLAAQPGVPGSATQFITLAPGAPVKVMTVGPNGQLIQTAGLPQFMPTTPVGMNVGQQTTVQPQGHTPVSVTTQRHAPTPPSQQNGRSMCNTSAATFFNGPTVASGSMPLVQTTSNGEEMLSVSSNPTLLSSNDDKLVYTAL